MKYFDTNATKPQLKTHDGQKYLVVPVIMAKAGVEMNGAVVNEDQLHPQSWNGVPVTIGHPKDSNGNDISANSPETLEKYRVGTIFNAEVEDGKLKAEAWVDVDKANAMDSELIARLQAMDAMDVSTGYFSEIENNEYKNIKPDHLALLPNEKGACDFNDGCGVRSNIAQEIITNIKQFFSNKEESNQKQQTNGVNMIDELIANDASPFTESDKESLEAMSDDTISALTEKYKEPKGDEKPKANSKEETPKESVLSNDDKEALELARQARDEKREEYITHITANSAMCKDKLAKMDTNTLKEIASGLKPAADYSGRSFGVSSNADKDEDIIKAMTPMSTAEYIQNKRKEVN